MSLDNMVLFQDDKLIKKKEFLAIKNFLSIILFLYLSYMFAHYLVFAFHNAFYLYKDIVAWFVMGTVFSVFSYHLIVQLALIYLRKKIVIKIENESDHWVITTTVSQIKISGDSFSWDVKKPGFVLYWIMYCMGEGHFYKMTTSTGDYFFVRVEPWDECHSERPSPFGANIGKELFLR